MRCDFCVTGAIRFAPKHSGYQYKRRDGVLRCTMEELEHWGDALEQQNEAWIGTPVEDLFK